MSKYSYDGLLQLDDFDLRSAMEREDVAKAVRYALSLADKLTGDISQGMHHAGFNASHGCVFVGVKPNDVCEIFKAMVAQAKNELTTKGEENE